MYLQNEAGVFMSTILLKYFVQITAFKTTAKLEKICTVSKTVASLSLFLNLHACLKISSHYSCIYRHTHAHTHTHTHTHIYLCVCVCVCIELGAKI